MPVSPPPPQVSGSQPHQITAAIRRMADWVLWFTRRSGSSITLGTSGEVSNAHSISCWVAPLGPGNPERRLVWLWLSTNAGGSALSAGFTATAPANVAVTSGYAYLAVTDQMGFTSLAFNTSGVTSKFINAAFNGEVISLKLTWS